MAKHYHNLINGSLVGEDWTITICQYVPSRKNVSEYVVKLEEQNDNVIYLVSVFLLRSKDNESKVVFCQRNNGVARVLRKRQFYPSAKIIPFPRDYIHQSCVQ